MSPTPIKREIVPSTKRKTISQFFISALTLFDHFDNMMMLFGVGRDLVLWNICFNFAVLWV